MSNFGYETRLCNMALVSAAASLEGFYDNILRIIKSNGNSYTKIQLFKDIKQTNQYKDIIEPLARRNCIVHNSAKVDSRYLAKVNSSSLNINDSLSIGVSYLEKASTSFFNMAEAITKIYIEKELLQKKFGETIGEFQYKIGLL